jgi:hypothetical protein
MANIEVSTFLPDPPELIDRVAQASDMLADFGQRLVDKPTVSNYSDFDLKLMVAKARIRPLRESRLFEDDAYAYRSVGTILEANYALSEQATRLLAGSVEVRGAYAQAEDEADRLDASTAQAWIAEETDRIVGAMENDGQNPLTPAMYGDVFFDGAPTAQQITDALCDSYENKIDSYRQAVQEVPSVSEFLTREAAKEARKARIQKIGKGLAGVAVGAAAVFALDKFARRHEKTIWL